MAKNLAEEADATTTPATDLELLGEADAENKDHNVSKVNADVVVTDAQPSADHQVEANNET